MELALATASRFNASPDTAAFNKFFEQATVSMTHLMMPPARTTIVDELSAARHSCAPCGLWWWLQLSRHQRFNHAHELDRMRPRRCHQRWLAESLPCITEIAEEVLTQLVAGALRPAFRIAGLARPPPRSGRNILISL